MLLMSPCSCHETNIYAHPDVCLEPMFSRPKWPFFSTVQRSLRRVVAANCCETIHKSNFVLWAWQGATPSVPSIPARRLEPRMKHVFKRWKHVIYYAILGQRWLGSGKTYTLWYSIHSFTVFHISFKYLNYLLQRFILPNGLGSHGTDLKHGNGKAIYSPNLLE